MTDPRGRGRGRRTLLLIAALFLVPLVIAFALYYGSQWRPGSRTNHGELIVPARPLPPADLRGADGSPAGPRVLRGKWTLLYVLDGGCDEHCRHALLTMRQTRLALANEMGRVQRVLLTSGGGPGHGDLEHGDLDSEFLRREHPGLLILEAGGAGAVPLLAEFAPSARADGIFIVDPLGNLMMRFDARQEPKGLLLDLKKLLTLSSIG